MKTCKALRAIFLTLALLLSHTMCAVVAYRWCALLWCGRYGGCSAPAGIAFLYLIPYGAGIAVCLLLALFFHKRAGRGKGNR